MIYDKIPGAPTNYSSAVPLIINNIKIMRYEYYEYNGLINDALIDFINYQNCAQYNMKFLRSCRQYKDCPIPEEYHNTFCWDLP